MERRQYAVGDVIRMKKKHPCSKAGCDQWKVLRIGADFRLECSGCGRQMMMPRPAVEKNTREIIKRT